MTKNSAVAIFLAASAALMTSNSVGPIDSAIAGDRSKSMGGLKEWTTDQDVDAESTLDDAAKKAANKAKDEDICIPIGEGENCW